MAAAKMRHFNSPEEVARRSSEPASGAPKHKEFRHYNHPDEVARRAAQGEPSAVVAHPRAPRRQRPEIWPPPGESNNAPVEAAAVLVEPAPVIENAKPDTTPPPPAVSGGSGDWALRLHRLENILFTFADSVAESRHFRMLLNNQQAVTDSQGDLINRVRALELKLTALVEDLGGDDDDDDDDDAPAVGSVGFDAGQRLPDPSLGIEPLPSDDVVTVDDSGKPEGSR
jgi:hypothetical protein